jgi:hypothetical protein
MAVTTKEKVAIAISSGMLATGLLTSFQPPSHDAADRQSRQAQQQVQDLSDAEEKEHQRMRDVGNDQAEAENARRLVPGEYRPAERPHLRIRIVP